MTRLVEHLNHVTLKCRPADLPRLRDFYAHVVGLEEGARPDFAFPGHWLYAGGQPIVHLAGLLDDAAAMHTGPLDHVAFTGCDLQATRRQLAEQRVPFDEAPVPGFPLHQVFFRDPVGLKVELTFSIGAPA